jgi:8-oxo-dGTP pyrophosphatase MutT (NUDIX family)
MTYTFSSQLRQRLEQNLTAYTPDELDSTGHKQAAVAVTIVPGIGVENAASMLLTKRTSRLNNHAGQWALPGGRIDEGESALQGALREMHEEVNLLLDESSLLGRLDDLQTKSGYIITPFVFWAEDASSLQANPDEVASIHHWPLSLFEGEESIQFIEQDHTEMPLLRLNMGGSRIHAPTAAVLLQLWEVGVHGRHTRVRDYAQPDWAT